MNAPDSAAAPARGCSRRAAGWSLAALLALAFGLRAWAALTAYCSTFDTATVGLMGLNILKGERPLFFYGQNYFGGLESYLAALLFALFGPSEFALSLSPILFSLLWIAATYLLFAELADRRAGLAAAALLAVPSWETVWYSIGTYGGYPAAFAYGTLALWLVARITGRGLAPRAYALHVVSLGALGGLALWTHFIAAAYLLTGGLLLLTWLLRARPLWPRLWPFLAGGVPFLLGITPVLLCSDAFTGGHVAKMSASPGVWRRHALELFERPLQAHLFGPWRAAARHAANAPAIARVLTVLAAVLLLAAAALYARTLWKTRGPTRRRFALPVLFAAVFLALYLPNAMADVQAARYVLPLWTLSAFALFAFPLCHGERRVRRAALAVLLLWLLYSAAAAAVSIAAGAAERRDDMDSRARTVARAQALGARTVQMIGGPIFGHKGQIYSFNARGEIAFVSCFDERHQPSAQAAEADDDAVLAIEKGHEPEAEQTLRDLGVTFSEDRSARPRFLHRINALPAADRALPPERLRVEAEGSVNHLAALTDRHLATETTGAYGSAGVNLRFTEPTEVCRLLLFPQDTRGERSPKDVVIEGSPDGRQWIPLRPSAPRLATGYVAGNRAWLLGYFGASEYRFPPARVLALRLRPLSGPKSDPHTWRLAELFVFERAGDATPIGDDEVRRIAGELLRRSIVFTLADRWLSAKLLNLLPPGPGGAPPALPRFNFKVKATYAGRDYRPAPERALAVARPLADETLRLLRETYGPDGWQTVPFEHYTLITGAARATTAPALFWNGHTLLRPPDDGDSGAPDE